MKVDETKLLELIDDLSMDVDDCNVSFSSQEILEMLMEIVTL